MDEHQRATLPSTHNRLSRPGRFAAVALAGLALIGAAGASASSASAAHDYYVSKQAVDLPPAPGATDFPPGADLKFKPWITRERAPDNATDLAPGPGAQAEIIAI